MVIKAQTLELQGIQEHLFSVGIFTWMISEYQRVLIFPLRTPGGLQESLLLKKEVTNPGTNLRTCVKLETWGCMLPLRYFHSKSSMPDVMTAENHDRLLVCLGLLSQLRNSHHCLCYHIFKINNAVSKHSFRYFNVELYLKSASNRLCALILEALLQISRHESPLLLFDFETWRREVLSLWGKAALAVREATRGAEARQPTTVLLRRIEKTEETAQVEAEARPGALSGRVWSQINLRRDENNLALGAERYARTHRFKVHQLLRTDSWMRGFSQGGSRAPLSPPA